MTNDNDLDWSAFCYLAGELSPAEAEAFEARLGTEQAAREALARSVELTQIVAAAEAQSAIVSPRDRSQAAWHTRLAWMAVGGLASLIAAMLYTGAWQHAWQAAWPSPHSGHQLAAAWSETIDQLRSTSDADLWFIPQGSSADPEDEQVAASTFPMDDVIDETPSWLDAAVLSMDGQPSNDTEASSDTSGD